MQIRVLHPTNVGLNGEYGSLSACIDNHYVAIVEYYNYNKLVSCDVTENKCADIRIGARDVVYIADGNVYSVNYYDRIAEHLGDINRLQQLTKWNITVFDDNPKIDDSMLDSIENIYDELSFLYKSSVYQFAGRNLLKNKINAVPVPINIDYINSYLHPTGSDTDTIEYKLKIPVRYSELYKLNIYAKIDVKLEDIANSLINKEDFAGRTELYSPSRDISKTSMKISSIQSVSKRYILKYAKSYGMPFESAQVNRIIPVYNGYIVGITLYNEKYHPVAGYVIYLEKTGKKERKYRPRIVMRVLNEGIENIEAHETNEGFALFVVTYTFNDSLAIEEPANLYTYLCTNGSCIEISTVRISFWPMAMAVCGNKIVTLRRYGYDYQIDIADTDAINCSFHSS